jgi:hypothetical protein
LEYILAIFIACFIPAVLIFIEPGHSYILGTILVFILAPGAFLALGYMIALANKIKKT